MAKELRVLALIYPKIKLVWLNGIDNKRKLVAHKFSLSPQIGTFHITVRTTMAKKCKEIKKK